MPIPKQFSLSDICQQQQETTNKKSVVFFDIRALPSEQECYAIILKSHEVRFTVFESAATRLFCLYRKQANE